MDHDSIFLGEASIDAMSKQEHRHNAARLVAHRRHYDLPTDKSSNRVHLSSVGGIV
jgi:hypothetical protein